MFDYVMGYNYKIGLCKNSEHERNQRGSESILSTAK